jgi:UDPglucose 6-dehydrogenase
MNISVVGSGYVGLVTGTCLADVGNDVTCIDIVEAKVKQMQSGIIPIFEPDLEGLFKKNIKEKRLSFTSSLAEGIKKAEVIFLALPTPPLPDGAADLSYILPVAEELGKLIDKYTVVITKSTVPVGTAKVITETIAKHVKTDFDVVSNPEFLREGFAVNDFMKPDRIIIGSTSKKARDLVGKMYKPFINDSNQCIYMDSESAELTKYAANAFLAMKISFMNEIANLAELTGANADFIRQGIGADERIGKRFLFAGIGYGGSCFPKDVLALSNIAEQNNYDFKLLKAVHVVNLRQKMVLQQKINKYYGSDLKDKNFALWGLSFKPDTDDIREAPAIELIKTLLTSGARVVCYDPEAMNNAKQQLEKSKNLKFVDSKNEVLKGADALIIATEWSEFGNPDFKLIKKSLKSPVIFDGRNIFDLETMKKEGFHYESIGRPVVG